MDAAAAAPTLTMTLKLLCLCQGCRKVSDIGEAPIKSVPKFPENIRGAQLLAAPNIGGEGHVPLCFPCSYGPDIKQLLLLTFCDTTAVIGTSFLTHRRTEPLTGKWIDRYGVRNS